VFHAPAGEISTETLQLLKKSKIDMNEQYRDFFMEILEVLESSQAPFERQLSDWVSTNTEGGESFFENLRRLGPAYSGIPFNEGAIKILNTIAAEKTKHRMSLLKSQLTQAAPEDQLKILKEIRDLSKSPSKQPLL